MIFKFCFKMIKNATSLRQGVSESGYNNNKYLFNHDKFFVRLSKVIQICRS
jgi:hypothetical protein